MKSDVIDIEGCVHHSTDRAILFSGDGDRCNAVWLPLAAIEVDTQSPAYRDGEPFTMVTMPERLAIDKGLV